MGGGLMALGTKLMGLGLGMGEIQNVARELFRFGRDKIGADQMGEIIAGDAGPQPVRLKHLFHIEYHDISNLRD